MTIFVKAGQKLKAQKLLREIGIKGAWSPFENGGWILAIDKMDSDDAVLATLRL